MANGHPEGVGGGIGEGEIGRALPPSKKHATTTIRNASAFTAEVTSCVLLPQLIPRHCKRKKPTITPTAMTFNLTAPAKTGTRAPLYSAMTMATAAAVPQVESQSLQPTMNPAYSPMARREKLYWPPLRGIAAPNPALDEALRRGKSPPMTHTLKNRIGLGSHCAMSPGARTIPAAIVLPTAAAMPNHMPRTLSRWP